MSQRTSRASATATASASARVVSSKKKDKQVVLGSNQSQSKQKRPSMKKHKKGTKKEPLTTHPIHTRRRSIVDVNNDAAAASIVPLVDWTIAQLYQRIMNMTESDHPQGDAFSEDRIIAEYLWRLGGDRVLFQQHFDVSTFQVLETSPILTQLKEYILRIRRRYDTNWLNPLADDVRREWIATLLTVRFILDENSVINPSRTDYAALLGDLRLLQWLTEHGYPKHPATTWMAVVGSNLDCLKYATEHGFEKHPGTTMEAASDGHLDCLKYATEHGFKKGPHATAEAASGGHLDCLKYATEHDFDKSTGTTMQAAAGGHLACLKYATEQGFVKHEDTTTQAARYGHLNCLIYATEHGYFKNPRAMFSSSDPECLQYMVSMDWSSPFDGRVADENDDGVEEQKEQRREVVPSFVFPVEWNDFPTSRIVEINIEMPMERVSAKDMNAMTRDRLDRLFGKTCYNAVEDDNVSMRDFLDEHKRNHVVALMPQQRATSDSANGTRVLRATEAMTRDQLVKQMSDLSAQFYPCVGRNGTFPVDKSVRFIKLPLSSNLYVPATDLDAMLSATHSDKQIWELTDSGLDVGTMASGSAANAQNYVSAHHCQSGTGRRIYRLSAIDIDVFYTRRLSMGKVDSSPTSPTSPTSSSSSSRRLQSVASNSNNKNNSKRSVKK